MQFTQFKDFLNENKYWTKSAGGAIIYSRESGRVLFLKRSEEENEGEQWCMTVGGGTDDTDPDMLFTVKREIQEEIGDTSKVLSIEPMEIFNDVDENTGAPFRYWTYFMVVDFEFPPVLNWEHTEWRWINILEDEIPQPTHFGLKETWDRVYVKIQQLELEK